MHGRAREPDVTAYLLTGLVVIVLQMLRAHTVTAQESAPSGRRASQCAIDVLCVVVLAAAPALRAEQVGTDTWMYVEMYDTSVETDSWTSTMTQSIVEPGYTVWEFVLKSAGLDARAFMIVTALVINGLQYEAIRVSRVNPLPAVSAYALSGVYLFQYNGMRQALAIALFLLGAVHVAGGRRLGWIPALMAATIHQSALLAAIAFAAALRFPGRSTFRMPAVLTAGGLLLAVLLISSDVTSAIAGLLGEKYGDYLGQDAGSGYGRIVHLFLMLLVVWFLNTTEVPAGLRSVSRFYSLGVGVQVVGLQLAVLDRATLYFAASLPLLTSSLVSQGSRARHAALWTAMAVYFCIWLVRYGDLLPYSWSWS